MANQNWSVMITASGFVVDAYEQSGSQLNATSGDIVSWNNQTADTHQPYQTDPSYQPQPGGALCQPIPQWSSSSPGYVIPAAPMKVYYYCANHPANEAERGTIVAAS